MLYSMTISNNTAKTARIKALFLIFIFTSCNYYDEERIDKTSTTFPNGKLLVVEKTNTESTAVGIFSNHNYGTTHRFTYRFSIKQDGINWDGGSGEPKNIVFCKDTTYMRYLKEKTIITHYTDSISNKTERSQQYETQAFFQKLIDKRYFFKLLGDAYWVDIPFTRYNEIQNTCDEYQIPNDNELVLPPDNHKALSQ